jgi:hypothetical protein
MIPPLQGRIWAGVLTAMTGSRRLTCEKKSASQRAKTLSFDGMPSLLARCLRECPTDDGLLKTVEVEVGSEEGAEVATKRRVRYLWNAGARVAVAGAGGDAAGSVAGNRTAFGLVESGERVVDNRTERNRGTGRTVPGGVTLPRGHYMAHSPMSSIRTCCRTLPSR